MKKVHEVESVTFESNWMLLRVDGQDYRIFLPEISMRLTSANGSMRNFFKISPSGYGIHWPEIDEDLTVDGLIRAAKNSYGNSVSKNPPMILNDKSKSE